MRYQAKIMSDITTKSTTAPDAKVPAKPATAANEVGESIPRSSRSEPDRGSLLRWISQRFRGKSAADFRDDLTDALAENDADGSSFSAGEREMLNNILTFREVSVEDVMIPRADVLGVDVDTTLAVLLDLFGRRSDSDARNIVKDEARLLDYGSWQDRFFKHIWINDFW